MDFKAILNEIIKFDSVDDIVNYIAGLKDVILTEVKKLFPKLEIIIGSIGSIIFDSLIAQLRTFESKDALIIKLNFYIQQVHEIVVGIVHIINGNDNEIL